MADAQRDVDTFVDHADHAIREQQLAANVGVAQQVRAHQRGEVQPPEERWAGDHEPSRRGAELGARCALGFLDIAEDTPGSLEEALARVGQGD